MLGIILLAGSLLIIGSMLARLGTATVASARDGDDIGSPRNQAVIDVGHSVARMVKYVVVPAGLLLLGGVLLRSGRRDDRVHQLNVEAEGDTRST